MTNQQLCDDLNFKYTTFMDWIKAVTYPRIGRIEEMAEYFGISISDLVEERTINNNPVEAAEIHVEMIMDEDLTELFEDFRKLNAKEKKIVKDLAHSLAEADA